MSLYTVLFHINFPSTSTLLFSEMSGQFVYQKIKEKKRKTQGRKGKKILEIAPTPALMLYEGLGPKSMCACQINPDFQNGYRRAQRSKEKKIAPELGKSLEQNSRKPLKSF